MAWSPKKRFAEDVGKEEQQADAPPVAPEPFVHYLHCYDEHSENDIVTTVCGQEVSWDYEGELFTEIPEQVTCVVCQKLPCQGYTDSDGEAQDCGYSWELATEQIAARKARRALIRAEMARKSEAAALAAQVAEAQQQAEESTPAIESMVAFEKLVETLEKED